MTMAGAIRKDTAGSHVGTDGDRTPLSVDASGRLWVQVHGSTVSVSGSTLSVSGSTINVNVVSVSGTTSQAVTCTTASTISVNGTVSVSGSTVSVSGSTVSVSGSTVSVSGSTVSVAGSLVNLISGQTGVAGNSGGNAANVLRVTVATDSEAVVSLGLIDDCVIQDDNPFTVNTHRVMMSGFFCDDVGTDSVAEGEAGAARMTADRRIYTVPSAHSQGGATPYSYLGTTVMASTIVKATAGQIYAISGFTRAISGPGYLKIYNTTADPTSSNTNPVFRALIPCSTVTGGAGFTMPLPIPIECTSGIGLRVTGGRLLDSDTAIYGTTAGDWTVNLLYE
jgi:hypothetical protein